MKGVLVILDGLGDLPVSQFGDKTPLEVADTPNMDFFAARGELGFLYSVKPGYVPESDEAIISIFGNEAMNSTRGQLEARGVDIKLLRGDLAFRTNFASIDSIEKGNVLDRRAGRTLTTSEAEVLAKAINKIKMPCEFIFKPTIQHRGVLVFRGGFSDNLLGNDAAYFRNKLVQGKIGYCKPLDELENTQYTVNIVNEFLEKAYEVLDKHPVNEERRKKGLLPANYLLVRGGGVESPKLKFYKKWLSVSYMPLEMGFAKTSGMSVVSFNYPKLKELDVYENLHEGLGEACKISIKALKKNYNKFDYAYIHIKETDPPGHDNKPIEKKIIIEYIDKTLFSFLRKFAPSRKLKIVVTGDHSTPCKMKSHSADPVPVLFYPAHETAPKETKFCEKEARVGTLGRMVGDELLKKTGFLK